MKFTCLRITINICWTCMQMSELLWTLFHSENHSQDWSCRSASIGSVVRSISFPVTLRVISEAIARLLSVNLASWSHRSHRQPWAEYVHETVFAASESRVVVRALLTICPSSELSSRNPSAFRALTAWDTDLLPSFDKHMARCRFAVGGRLH